MEVNVNLLLFSLDLTSYELLRKDLKCVSGPTTVIAMSSLPVHLHVSTSTKRK